jgi:hypothetical protein
MVLLKMKELFLKEKVNLLIVVLKVFKMLLKVLIIIMIIMEMTLRNKKI